MKRVLPVIAGALLSRFRRNVNCQACGNQFSCGASTKGCWCAEIELTAEARSQLRAQFSDCLCRSCLQKFAVAEEENRVQRAKI